MNLHYDFEIESIIIVPESSFEIGFLSNLIEDSTKMDCEVFGKDGVIEFITLKPVKEIANSEENETGITVNEVNIMYDKFKEEIK